jgi:hypothetical protein
MRGMSMWQRWGDLGEHREDIEMPTGYALYAARMAEARLREELRQLLQQRHDIEPRHGDAAPTQEATAHEIEQLEQRIKALKHQQLRLRMQGKFFR